MIKKLLTLPLFLSALWLTAQRLPTDAVVIPFSSSYNNQGTYHGLFPLNGSVYSARHATLVTHVGGLAGDVIVEKRGLHNLQTQSSLLLSGKVNLFQADQDNQGNIYLVASWRDSLEISNQKWYAAQNTPFLLKLDSNLNVIWMNQNVDAEALSVSPNGHKIYLRGEHHGSAGNVQISVLDSSGTLLTTKMMNGIGYLADIKATSAGELYFGGGCLSTTFLMDSANGAHNFNYSLYYGMLDDSLKGKWIKVMDDITCEEPQLELDANENLIAYVPLNKNLQLDNFNLVANPGSGGDFLLTLTLKNGQVQWVQDLPTQTVNYAKIRTTIHNSMAVNDTAIAIMVDQRNANDTVHWGNGWTTVNPNAYNPVIVEYNINSGNLFAASTFSTPTSEKLGELRYLSNGDLLINGVVGGNSLSTSTTTLSANLKDYYLERWEHSGMAVNVSENASLGYIKIYPNPSRAIFKCSKAITGTVYNLSGQQILSIKNAKEIDLSEQPSGIYFLKLENGEVSKLIVD